MFIVLPLLAALVPVLITPGFLFYFDITPKILLLVLGTAAALLEFRSNRRNVTALWSTRPGRWFILLLAAQFLSLVLSALLSPDSALAWNGGNWRRFGAVTQSSMLLFALLAAAWLSANPGGVRVVLRATICGGIVAAIYGILQYFGWDPFLPAASYQAGEGPFTIVRPPGTLGHADYFATYLLFVVGAAAGVFHIDRQPFWRALAVSAVVLGSVAIVLSGTRAALLGLAIGIIVAVAWSRPRIRLAQIAAAGALAGAFVLFYFSPAGLKLRARAHWSLEDLQGGARLLLWRDSLRMAAARPLVGFGPDTFTGEFPRFESVDLSRAYPDFYHESPHNAFLDALVSRGVPGLLILIALCALVVHAARRALPDRSALAGALLATFVAALTAEQFSVLVAPTAFYFYLTMAMLVSLTPSKASDQQWGSPNRWLLAVASIVFSAYFAFFGLRLLALDRMLARTQHAIEAGNVQDAANAYAQARRWRPGGSSADIYYSRSMMARAGRAPDLASKLEAWKQAGSAAFSAPETSEDPANAWYNLAVFYGVQDDARGAEMSLRRAIACAPNWFKPHWTLAQILRAKGNLAEARQEAEVAANLDGGKHPEVSHILKQLQGLVPSAH